MYFPYLRAKQFELAALMGVNHRVYSNTIPIVEPVVDNTGRRNQYAALTAQNIPLIFITNPEYPVANPIPVANIQSIINAQLAGNANLRLGFIVNQNSTPASMTTFLKANVGIRKAIIFRHNPLSADEAKYYTLLTANPPEFIAFDSNKTSHQLRTAFASITNSILISDGFQYQAANRTYPAVSTFASDYSTYVAQGYAGIGDYLIIGDHFSPGGGPVYVVALHVTKRTRRGGIETHHFLSVSNPNNPGLSQIKFPEANNALVSSRHITGMTSTGLTMFHSWHTSAHNPQLGAAKQASMQHHIELMSSIV